MPRMLAWQMNAASKRNDYHGALRNRVSAVVSTLYGGQIMMEQQAFHGISGAADGNVTFKPLDLTELERQHRCPNCLP